MKAKSKILIFTLVASWISLARAGGGESYSYTVTSERNSVSISPDGASISGGEMISAPGAPAIGYKLVKLVLPPNTKVTDIFTETSEPESIWNGDIDFVRGDEKTGNYQEEIAGGPDQSIYGRNELFPENRVVLLNSGYWGRIHVADLAVYPVAYNPVSGEVLFYRQIIIRFNLEPLDAAANMPSRNDSYSYDILLDKVANADEMPVMASPGGDSEMLLGNMPDIKYLIITSAGIAPGFYPLLNWKNQKGMPTDMVLIEDILATTAGRDPAEQLRNYLIQAYNDGIVYVLLGGDEDVVPIRYLYPNNVNGSIPELHLQQISDLYFADMTGDWDYDGDGVWGESYNDRPDIYPELYVGRVPARNADQAAMWSSKAIKYEKNPGNGDPSYLTKALFICSDQMRDMNQHSVLASMLPGNFTYDAQRLIEEPSGNDPNPTQPLAETVIEVMQEGWGFVSNLNHGDFSWYASQAAGYNAYDRSGVWGDTVLWEGCGALSHLTTFQQPAIHYSISCDLAAFDFDKGVFFPPPYVSPYCFMESYMFEPGAGVAFLGNTRWGWVSSSYNLEKKFVTHAFHDSTNRLALAEALSKIDYPNHRDICYGHNLFGDPEMSMWLAVDGFLQVWGPTEMPIGSPQILTYTVTWADHAGPYLGPDSTLGPIAGVKVCLYKAGEILETAFTDESGEVTFNAIIENDGYMTATALKPDYIPAQQTVVVGTPLGIDKDLTLPDRSTIFQNYPNPFNPSTIIEFNISKHSMVNLDIYDIRGRLVKNLVSDEYNPGKYSVVWYGDNRVGQQVASGVYFYKFATGSTTMVRQMTILK